MFRDLMCSGNFDTGSHYRELYYQWKNFANQTLFWSSYNSLVFFLLNHPVHVQRVWPLRGLAVLLSMNIYHWFRELFPDYCS